MATRVAGRTTTTTPKVRASATRRAGWGLAPVSRRIWQLLSNRWLMAIVVILGTLRYMWNAPHVIDYPVYDESFYFIRGWSLDNGDVVRAAIANPNSSPLYIAYYAIWYAVLHTVDLYPLVFASGVIVLGLGAYALLSRTFHPILASLTAWAVVTWTVPFAPVGLYIFASGCLWLSLAVLGPRLWQRALGLTLVVLCVLLRPDFAQVAITLAVLLLGYEVWRWRRTDPRPQWRTLSTAYAPVVLAGVVLVYLFLTVPGASGGRSAFAIPWSYSEYYSVVYPAQFDPRYDLTDVWRLFQQDFGTVPPPRSTGQTLVAMTRNPPKALAYLQFEGEQLVASFGTATLRASGWQANAQQTQLPIIITSQDTLGFLSGLALFFGATLGCAVWLRSRGIAIASASRRNVPCLLGYISLIGLLPLLILINPYQRFYMLYPLLLLPFGWGLECFWSTGQSLLTGMLPSPHVRVSRTMLRVVAPVALLSALAVMPHPYSHEPSRQPVARTLAFLSANVPAGATVIGEPADSYANYLRASGDEVRGLQAEQYPYSVIVNALTANPTLQQVYVLFNPKFPYSAKSQWVTGWQQTYPQLPLTVIATDPQDRLTLVALPPYVGDRIAYLQFASASAHAGYTGLPRYEQMSFGAALQWNGGSRGNNLATRYVPAWGMNLTSLVMHPAGPGVSPTVPHDISTTLPQEWSGETLVFAATLAPWAANQPRAQGVKFIVSVAGTRYTQTFDIPNTYPNQHWVPVIVHLPTYSGTPTLDVRVVPRVSILYDTSLFTFLGVASSVPSSASAATGTSASGGTG